MLTQKARDALHMLLSLKIHGLAKGGEEEIK
jgi:hypothetical protein